MLPLYFELIVTTPSVRKGYQQVSHFADGWYMRCHRGVEAILALDALGYGEEASPIRRSVIEHCVALRWLAAEGDEIVDTVARGHANDTERRRKALETAQWTSVNPDDLAKIIEEIDPDSREDRKDYLLSFARRCAEYGDVHTIPGYLAECGQTHPGYQSAITYVDLASGTMRPNPQTEIWQVPFCTTQVLEALFAVREIFIPKPWGSELRRVLAGYRKVTNDVRREDGLRPVDWSTGKLTD